MKLIVNPKTKKQEKVVKEFLDNLDIEFTMAEEESLVYKTTPTKQLSKREKEILNNLSQSVEFVKKFKKGKSRTKSFNKLLNEL